MSKASANLSHPQITLQELLDRPPRISQIDLCELANLQDRVRVAKIDYEAVATQMVERLVRKWPVESGRFGVRLNDSRLELFEKEAR